MKDWIAFDVQMMTGELASAQTGLFMCLGVAW